MLLGAGCPPPAILPVLPPPAPLAAPPTDAPALPPTDGALDELVLDGVPQRVRTEYTVSLDLGALDQLQPADEHRLVAGQHPERPRNQGDTVGHPPMVARRLRSRTEIIAAGGGPPNAAISG